MMNFPDNGYIYWIEQLKVKLRLHTAINRADFGPGECDLMVHLRKYSQRHSLTNAFCPSNIYNTHQDMKSARLIAVCKRTLT